MDAMPAAIFNPFRQPFAVAVIDEQGPVHRSCPQLPGGPWQFAPAYCYGHQRQPKRRTERLCRSHHLQAVSAERGSGKGRGH
eukprot:67252-Lingulodinium_polyedra.AAC.1